MVGLVKADDVNKLEVFHPDALAQVAIDDADVGIGIRWVPKRDIGVLAWKRGMQRHQPYLIHSAFNSTVSVKIRIEGRTPRALRSRC